MPTVIRVRQNGSLLVEGEDATLVDWNGDAYELSRRPFSLCRCGQSTRRPFCDGSHKTIGFVAAEAATPAGTEKPPA